MVLCMRTTIDIPGELLRRAKRRAADERTSVSQVVEEALRQYLATKPRLKGFRLRWRSESGRLLPGVRLDDRGSLLAFMADPPRVRDSVDAVREGGCPAGAGLTDI